MYVVPSAAGHSAVPTGSTVDKVLVDTSAPTVEGIAVVMVDSTVVPDGLSAKVTTSTTVVQPVLVGGGRLAEEDNDVVERAVGLVSEVGDDGLFDFVGVELGVVGTFEDVEAL